MTVLVWDGERLGADTMCSDGVVKWAGQKVWSIKDPSGGSWLVSGVGVARNIYAMKAWAEGGFKEADFPPVQKAASFCTFIAVPQDGDLHVYGPSHLPEHIDRRVKMAWGTGRAYALGALAMGATMEQAIAIACELSPNCGLDMTGRTVNAVSFDK